jgi:hypothetical protein
VRLFVHFGSSFYKEALPLNTGRPHIAGRVSCNVFLAGERYSPLGCSTCAEPYVIIQPANKIVLQLIDSIEGAGFLYNWKIATEQVKLQRVNFE